MNSEVASPTALFEAALGRYTAGAPVEAARLFAEVLQQRPDHADALRLHGLSLIRAGRATDALPSLSRARRLAPGEPLTHLHYGMGLLEAGRAARATAVLRRAVAMLPGEPAAWVNFSTALLAVGKAPAARAAARRAIKLAPKSAEAHCALGLAEQAANDLPAAQAALTRATALAPGFADGWVYLGLVCFQMGQAGAATRAMQRALDARPGYAVAAANLAGFQLLQGDFEGAANRLRAVLERNPGCVPAKLNLANALLLDRESSAALALFDGTPPAGREGAHWRAHRAMALLMLNRNAEAAAELDGIRAPYDAEILIVWRRLILAERAGDESSVLMQAERLATLGAEEGAALLEHRILSHFDLAAFRNRRREPDQAFAHWTAGHALMRRVQPFSRPDFTAFVDASIAAFDAARFAVGPRAEPADPAPVFIVGMPRSGTSLTEQILAAHPMVHGAGERPDLYRTINQLAGPPTSPASVRRLAALDAAALSDAAAPYVAALQALAPAARHVIDKMPGNALHLGFAATLLPGARIILCRRDPRDIGLSIFQFRFFGYHPYAHDLGDLGWYMGEHERLMMHWRRVLPVPLLEVELAEWVGDFRGTLTRVLDFLGLPYDEACERFYLQRRRVQTASADQVRQPINARGLGRWRTWQRHLGPMLMELEAAGLADPSH